MNENINAAQLQARREAVQNALGEAIQQMQLRKWTLEQALKIATSPGFIAQSGEQITEIADRFYAFVAKPALELVAKADK